MLQTRFEFLSISFALNCSNLPCWFHTEARNSWSLFRIPLPLCFVSPPTPPNLTLLSCQTLPQPPMTWAPEHPSRYSLPTLYSQHPQVVLPTQLHNLPRAALNTFGSQLLLGPHACLHPLLHQTSSLCPPPMSPAPRFAPAPAFPIPSPIAKTSFTLLPHSHSCSHSPRCSGICPCPAFLRSREASSFPISFIPGTEHP